MILLLMVIFSSPSDIFIYCRFMSFLDNSNGIFFRQESYFAYLFGVREPGFYGAIVSFYCCFIFPSIWDSAICHCLSFIYAFPDWYMVILFFFTVFWVVDFHRLHNGPLYALYYYIRHIWHFYFVEMPPSLHQGVDFVSIRLVFLKGIKAWPPCPRMLMIMMTTMMRLGKQELVKIWIDGLKFQYTLNLLIFGLETMSIVSTNWWIMMMSYFFPFQCSVIMLHLILFEGILATAFI